VVGGLWVSGDDLLLKYISDVGSSSSAGLGRQCVGFFRPLQGCFLSEFCVPLQRATNSMGLVGKVLLFVN